MVGGNGNEFCPRMVQSPIGLTPLMGWVGSLPLGPGGRVPAGKTLPLSINKSPRLGPPTNVRQSAAMSTLKLNMLSSAARTMLGKLRTATAAVSARLNAIRLIVLRRFMVAPSKIDIKLHHHAGHLC